MSETPLVRGADVPLQKLMPRHERKVTKRQYQRIEASIRAVGLIEPLIVYPQNGHFEILDGCVRFRILSAMGVETVPCLFWSDRESYTANRMVNRLSVPEEMRMLRRSLEELDEKTIETALMASVSYRLNQSLLNKLSPEAASALEAGKITRQCAQELSHVKPERQVEILKLMASSKDYGATFARGLVLKTPAAKRVKNGTKTPWSKAEQNKSNLLKRLREAEQQQNFFSSLYRDYASNLLKLVMYTRLLLSNEGVKRYLEERHGQELDQMTKVLTACGE